jgi:Uncharacterized protein conserved in bacteria
MEKIRCVIMRGGTSKGVFFRENDLPCDIEERKRVILKVMGSPDKRQIDGLGGADILTSKVAIIGPPSKEDADLDYSFGQIGINEPIIDWGFVCGNLSAAVGPFAVEEGLIKAQGLRTSVKVYCPNVGKYLTIEFPTKEGKVVYEGDYVIDGVPGSGAKIALDFSDTAGMLTGKLLPTGNRKDVIEVKNIGKIEVSIIDASMPVAHIRARDFGLMGTESAVELDANKELLHTLEQIRVAVARLIKLDEENYFMPAVALVQEPVPWKNSKTGEMMNPENITILSKVYGARMMHKAYPGTASIATAVAVRLKGSVVHEFIPPSAADNETITIGHFAGLISVDVICREKDSKFWIEKAVAHRTARRIMEGYVYL